MHSVQKLSLIIIKTIVHFVHSSFRVLFFWDFNVIFDMKGELYLDISLIDVDTLTDYTCMTKVSRIQRIGQPFIRIVRGQHHFFFSLQRLRRSCCFRVQSFP
uniref:Uncharacterized protein n=1 Tax=Cacopsylla melanoneura TaxID=428564 RepID=A0A8D9AHE7_9HEMI